MAAGSMRGVARATPSAGADASGVRRQVKDLLDRYGDGVAPVVQLGDPGLRATAQRYDGQLEEKDLLALVELMRRTMQAGPGVGLAAAQIGIPLQLAVIEDRAEVTDEVAIEQQRYPQKFLAVLNPSYAPTSMATASFYESCLSVAGCAAKVRRQVDVVLRFTDLAGTKQFTQFTGWPARIVQHEIDHLHGVLYLDKAEPGSVTEISGSSSN